MDAEWTGLMGKYWSCAWLRSAEDVREASAEIERTFGRKAPANEELCETIRWLAGPENKHEKCPTLRELIRAIWIRRKADRKDSGQAETVFLCLLCRNTGWAVASSSRYPNGASMPCLCRMGQDIGQKLYPPQEYESMQELVKRQYPDAGRDIGRDPVGMMRFAPPDKRWDIACDMGRNEEEVNKYLAAGRGMSGGVTPIRLSDGIQKHAVTARREDWRNGGQEASPMAPQTTATGDAVQGDAC